GTWQYCTGRTCSDGSKRCSNYCVNDYFPNSCSNSSYCNGVYRNGYCSGSCNPPASSGGSSSGWCEVHGSYHGDCCTDGTLSPSDPQCTGSGSSSSSSGSSGGGSSSSGSGSSGSGSSSGSTCNKFKSCSNKCTGVINTVPHCQQRSGFVALNCGLNITRDWVNCSGQSKTTSGTAYDRIGSYSTSAACEAARSTKTCSCSSYRWPYDCEGVSGTISFD
ncbi:MAG: hypothetical protein SO314_00635, partial [Alphaproteobacteria bacterium]|nr:hypothetical protein [Alphaproteobacteria bacterium]